MLGSVNHVVESTVRSTVNLKSVAPTRQGVALSRIQQCATLERFRGVMAPPSPSATQSALGLHGLMPVFAGHGEKIDPPHPPGYRAT
jgi:hypothetical protein